MDLNLSQNSNFTSAKKMTEAAAATDYKGRPELLHYKSLKGPSEKCEACKVPEDMKKQQVYVVSSGSVNAIESVDSPASFSRRSLSSKQSISVNIEVEVAGEVGGGDEEEIYPRRDQRKKRGKICICLHKAFGNYILPGVFGIERFRYVELLSPKSAIARELISNLTYYSSKLRIFFGAELVPEMRHLSTLLYFPTGQVEADGLAVISAEIWTATYLLLGIHKQIREADFYSMRGAYSSLAWDSSQNYRATLTFYRTLEVFKQSVIPIWKEVEAMVGLRILADYVNPVDCTPEKKCKTCMQTEETKRHLTKVKVRDDESVLGTGLVLQVIPERKAEDEEKKKMEMTFNELGYGKQVELIKEILKKPVIPLEAGIELFRRTGPKLAQEKLTLEPWKEENSELVSAKDEELMEIGLTCTKAMKILATTLKILWEEVRLTETMRFDITELIRALSTDIEAYFVYSDWVCDKFSEFHSMLRLCYNFALLCFDLDLPSFDSVLKMEEKSTLGAGDTKSKAPIVGSNANNNNISSIVNSDEELEFKVVSLTHLMTTASHTFQSPGKPPMIDEDFNYEDFYRTDYHVILQKLPIRVGYNLLKFTTTDEDVTVFIRQRTSGTAVLEGNPVLRDQVPEQTLENKIRQ